GELLKGKKGGKAEPHRKKQRLSCGRVPQPDPFRDSAGHVPAAARFAGEAAGAGRIRGAAEGNRLVSGRRA
nr:hypothetical protein [Tanacetum cinerariifolium]